MSQAILSVTPNATTRNHFQPVNAIAPIPIDQLRLSAALDGSFGSNRANKDIPCQLSANNDQEAISVWLSEFLSSPHTFRLYRKEAERLLLWSIIVRNKPLSSLTREDCILYENFMANPQPRHIWCGNRAGRFNEDWRPFMGPLNLSSRLLAIKVLKGLFSYLVQSGYLAGNPFSLSRRCGQKNKIEQQIERYLDNNQWLALIETVENLPNDNDKEMHFYVRAKYLISFLYLLGARVGELSSNTMASFIKIRGNWWWNPVGKGGKISKVPVNQEMLNELQRYRSFYGLNPLPEPEEKTPLVMTLGGKIGISANMIYRIIKDLMAQTATRLEITDPHNASKLRIASVHWLRHTSITHQANAGIDLRFIQRNARHSSIRTTGLYLHADESEWHASMGNHTMDAKS